MMTKSLLDVEAEADAGYLAGYAEYQPRVSVRFLGILAMTRTYRNAYLRGRNAAKEEFASEWR